MNGLQWSVLVCDGHGYPLLEQDSKLVLRTASVAKIFVLLELAQQIQNGDIQPNETVSKTQLEAVADSGLWQHLDATEISVVDAARLIGSVSDNLATNALIDRLGLAKIQETARQFVSGDTSLNDRVRDQRTEYTPSTLSQGTASDWVSTLQAIRAQRIDSESPASLVSAWLRHSVDLSMVASAFDLDPLSHGAESGDAIIVWNKTGTDLGVRADVGVVEFEDRHVTYAVICNWTAETIDDRRIRRDAYSTMRKVGKMIEKHLREAPQNFDEKSY